MLSANTVWKYLILLGYSAAVFALSEFSYHRLCLRKTGTVLMALTVLLIPLSFLALHWVRPHEADSTMSLIQNSAIASGEMPTRRSCRLPFGRIPSCDIGRLFPQNWPWNVRLMTSRCCSGVRRMKFTA